VLNWLTFTTQTVRISLDLSRGIDDNTIKEKRTMKKCKKGRPRGTRFYGPEKPSKCEGCGCRFTLPKRSKARGKFCSLSCYRGNPTGFITEKVDVANGHGSLDAVRRYMGANPWVKHHKVMLAEHKKIKDTRSRASRRAAKQFRRIAGGAMKSLKYNLDGSKRRKRRKPIGACYNCGVAVDSTRIWCSDMCNTRHKKDTRRAKESIGKVNFTAICDRQGYRCKYCGRHMVAPYEHGNKLSLTKDHVVPLSKGGNHEESNIVACCLECNSSKSSRMLEHWMKLGGPPCNRVS
jgi:5-methylcytosine-specific restriction endonuclease McrA